MSDPFAQIRKLRKEGYAVIIFSEEELNGVDPIDFEEAMVAESSHVLDNLSWTVKDTEDDG